MISFCSSDSSWILGLLPGPPERSVLQLPALIHYWAYSSAENCSIGGPFILNRIRWCTSGKPLSRSTPLDPEHQMPSKNPLENMNWFLHITSHCLDKLPRASKLRVIRPALAASCWCFFFSKTIFLVSNKVGLVIPYYWQHVFLVKPNKVQKFKNVL